MGRVMVFFRAAGAILGLPLVVFVAPAAQAPKPQIRTAEQQYKNIQVLQGTPADQMTLTMHVVNGALGVECEFCHDAADRSKDDKETKRIARRMMVMTFEIDKNSFGGGQRVTCYTCHRGSPIPPSMQSLPVTLSIPEGTPAPLPALPTADEILSKYVKALGGEQAIRRITRRVIIAKRDIPTGVGGVVPLPARVEQYQKEPNLTLNISQTDKFVISDGYDGVTAWSQSATGLVTELPSPDQERTKRSADFYESLNLKQEYGRLSVLSIEKVNGRDAYLVVGFPKDDAPEQLYFDEKTGLLLRKVTSIRTVMGDSPFETDYEDYRDTGSGVKIPFVIHMFPGSARSHLHTHSTMRIEKVRDNVPIDSARFVKPRSQESPVGQQVLSAPATATTK